MSTEWYFFAFDAASFDRFVMAPALAAVESRDGEAWFGLLSKLSDVYSPARLTRYGFNGSHYSVTNVDPKLPIDRSPAAGSEQLLELFKRVLEALSEFRLIGSCYKPSGVFSELGFPERLSDPAERQQFQELADVFFRRRAAAPPRYEFVTLLNQGAGLALGPQVVALAEAEIRVGLLDRLSHDLANGEWRDLAADAGHLRHFLQLAASRALSIYYREDAT